MHKTWIQRALSAFGKSDEEFLRMENADEFLAWCVRWRAPLILHGHKHVPRYVNDYLTARGAPGLSATALGCGSSLGAEGTPMGFTVVYWNERGRRFGATFYESVQGGPFLERLTSVVTAPRES